MATDRTQAPSDRFRNAYPRSRLPEVHDQTRIRLWPDSGITFANSDPFEISCPDGSEDTWIVRTELINGEPNVRMSVVYSAESRVAFRAHEWEAHKAEVFRKVREHFA